MKKVEAAVRPVVKDLKTTTGGKVAQALISLTDLIENAYDLEAADLAAALRKQGAVERLCSLLDDDPQVHRRAMAVLANLVSANFEPLAAESAKLATAAGALPMLLAHLRSTGTTQLYAAACLQNMSALDGEVCDYLTGHGVPEVMAAIVQQGDGEGSVMVVKSAVRTDEQLMEFASLTLGSMQSRLLHVHPLTSPRRQQRRRGEERAQQAESAVADSADWAKATASTFATLQMPAYAEAGKPDWWNDEELKELSARVVGAAPNEERCQAMRATVLSGGSTAWERGARSAAEIRQAAEHFVQAGCLAAAPAAKAEYARLANWCRSMVEGS